MDRSLPENHRFRLNEDTYSNNDGKFYVFVKLTDSCMQTIETYLKSNKKSNLSIKSNILFNQHGGDLSIPMNNNERKTYSFQISPEDKTPEVFQCIKQINKDQLESCGLIEQRINIQAQEDVYSMTKKKVTKFQENDDLTKKKTKEIGESSKTILQKKANKTSNSRSSTTVNPISKQQRPAITTTSTTAIAAAATANDESVSQKPNNPLSSADRPLRERLIHLLAAKTYKKPELLARLRNEGIRDEEKEQLDSILSSISTQTRNGEFLLQKHFYTNGEVNHEWPYYLKAEAPNVRKKIKDHQANANRTNQNKTTNDVRPSSTNLNSKSNTQFNSSVNRPSSTTTTNPTEPSEEINSNSLSDDKIQQLSDMLDKMSSTLQQIEKTQQSSSENDSIEIDDYDQAQQKYNLLAPEYNQLIDYLNSVSEKFQSIQQDFHEEPNSEKAKKIVEEFLKHENREGFLAKRQRVVELHVKLNHLQKILHKNTSQAFDFQISEDDDDDDELF